MSIGERIRKYRNEVDMTQRELAEEVGLTESAIRDIGVEGARGALEVLFRCERELGLSPVVTDDGVAVAPDPARPGSQKAAQALKAWKRMRDRLSAGEISEGDYEAWKARFRG